MDIEQKIRRQCLLFNKKKRENLFQCTLQERMFQISFKKDHAIFLHCVFPVMFPLISLIYCRTPGLERRNLMSCCYAISLHPLSCFLQELKNYGIQSTFC
ncbi:hypothetical protein A7K73_03720 [Candidatus Methylacidiphilum fumarolicum]|nr:hypothetical protein A7K73_03720 [Candidatus Methylacidiphilum fumarolicum]TFE74751.1 hypothetical protein A7K72_03000 [Candidatus Methylacidiphilum fumarolicum]TFE76424.1 hypothetical protein A7D33_00905 [Candidatus Methylacidiphilum fumarolicum]